MSWLSKALGLDKNKKVETEVNAVGNAVLGVAEAANPTVGAVVNAVEGLGNAVSTVTKSVTSNSPTTNTTTLTITVEHAIEQEGEVLVEKAISVAALAAAKKFGVPDSLEEEFVAELDKLLEEGFAKLGVHS
jgi:hypothetical protein